MKYSKLVQQQKHQDDRDAQCMAECGVFLVGRCSTAVLYSQLGHASLKEFFQRNGRNSKDGTLDPGQHWIDTQRFCHSRRAQFYKNQGFGNSRSREVRNENVMALWRSSERSTCFVSHVNLPRTSIVYLASGVSVRCRQDAGVVPHRDSVEIQIGRLPGVSKQ